MAKKKEQAPIGDLTIDLAVQSIRKHWGTDSIFVPGEETTVKYDVLSTGIPQLDKVLGNGGIVKGSIIELFGIEGSGKSSLCLQIIAEAQRQGVKTLFIDQEHALDAAYAEAIGVCTDDLYIAQPGSLEEALGIAETFIKTGQIGIVVVDSIASLVPISEVEADVSQQSMGVQARLLSAWLRRQNPNIANTGTILIFTNQLRDKVGSYGGGSVTPGGRAVKFYSSYRLEIKVTDRVKTSDGVIIGNQLRVTAVKNKKHPPFRWCDLKLMFGEGVDVLESDVMDAVGYGIYEKSGSWYSLADDVVFDYPGFAETDRSEFRWQGITNSKLYLLTNSPFREALSNKLQEYRDVAY